MRRGLAARCLALASRERGVFLWVPGLLLGTALILFGIHQAPQGTSLFTRTTGVRIVLGPWEGPPDTGDARRDLLHGLRAGLQRYGSLAVVDSVRVARRLREAGYAADRPSSEAFLQAMRALNPHLALHGRVEPAPGGVRAWLEALDVHESARSFACEATGRDGRAVGEALAESVCARVFAPASPAPAPHD